MKLLIALAVVGCGDNVHPEQPDATPLPDAFAEAMHSEVPQVVSGGGPVLATPIVVPIFYANDDAQPTIEQFLTALAPSPYWHTVSSEYGVGALTIAPSVVASVTPPTTDTDLETWLDTNFPTPDPNTIYTVFLPAGVTLDDGGGKSCVQFGGYHSETDNGLVYALLPRCASATAPLDPTTGATSHELLEASTDPHPFSMPAYTRLDSDHFVWGRTPGGELGDMCEYVGTAFQPLVGSFVVQRMWSNASAAAGHDPCVPETTTYLGAAPVLPETLTLMQHSGTITTQGVTVNSGDSKQIEVDLFSDAPSDDFTVEALDAGAITGSPVSLEFEWGHYSGHNGDKLQLLITRTKPGTSRGSEFVIRARKDNQVVSLWWGLAVGQ